MNIIKIAAQLHNAQWLHRRGVNLSICTLLYLFRRIDHLSFASEADVQSHVKLFYIPMSYGRVENA